ERWPANSIGIESWPLTTSPGLAPAGVGPTPWSATTDRLGLPKDETRAPIGSVRATSVWLWARTDSGACLRDARHTSSRVGHAACAGAARASARTAATTPAATRPGDVRQRTERQDLCTKEPPRAGPQRACPATQSRRSGPGNG